MVGQGFLPVWVYSGCSGFLPQSMPNKLVGLVRIGIFNLNLAYITIKILNWNYLPCIFFTIK